MHSDKPAFSVIIPARYASTRLPGKPLLKIGDKTLIQHVIDKAVASSAESVYVATDDSRIEEHIKAYDRCGVVMTSPDCQSGTLRLAEAAETLSLDDAALIVNIQGDEPFITTQAIDTVATALSHNQAASMATLKEKLEDASMANDINVVKVVTDKDDFALYFSRSVLPNLARKKEDTPVVIYKHLGIYAYSVGYIKKYAHMPECELEQVESLEQLRALYNGDKIIVKAVTMPVSVGIDTPEDLQKANEWWQKNNRQPVEN